MLSDYVEGLIDRIVGQAMIQPKAFEQFLPSTSMMGFDPMDVNDTVLALGLFRGRYEQELEAYHAELLDGRWGPGEFVLGQDGLEDEIRVVHICLQACERFEEIAEAFSCEELDEEYDEYREAHAHRMRQLTHAHLTYRLRDAYLETTARLAVDHKTDITAALEAAALAAINDESFWAGLHASVLEENGIYELPAHVARLVGRALDLQESLDDLPDEFDNLRLRGLPRLDQEA